MKPTRRSYKEIRLQQLRSLCETARTGSLTAAAEALGIAQPTVWEQVHALERAFAAPLIQRQAHGCRLTETGALLVELAAPLVTTIDSLKRRVAEARGKTETLLTVATNQRILVEDLPNTILEFERRHPNVRLRLLEQRIEQVAGAVESGQADVGLTSIGPTRPPSPRLTFEPGYEADINLVTPLDHPLARRRTVRPGDLLAWPVVNSPQSFGDTVMRATLEKAGLFQTQPRRIEASFPHVVRRYVELGFGIGLVTGLPTRPIAPNLHERSMSRYFGKLAIHLVWRKGDLNMGHVQAFAEILRGMLKARK
ncbi:MAG: LysR family transcriptional regulator [Gemmataceae bacterium]|nr:LysR family transcriptional regulator [Gemmataceae bacterium]